MRLGYLGALIMISVFMVTLVYAGAILYFTWPITTLTVEQSGVFGDSFGLLTALFSGLAFGGLILTILLQREDLQLQRQELRLTREEMKAQNFENTYFQMLRLHNDIVSAIDLRGGTHSRPTITVGRDCFSVFAKRLRNEFVESVKRGSNPNEPSTIEIAYAQFWKENQQELGHYFRYLYRIFKFIDGSEAKDKRLYSGIARAQLSDRELLLLFYNCLSDYGRGRFKPLAEKYALFDNLPVDTLFAQSHYDLFARTAWGENARAQSGPS